MKSRVAVGIASAFLAAVLLGASARAQTPALVSTNVAVGQTPYSVDAGDLNQDGRVELAVANAGAGSVSILYQAPSGVFSPAIDVAVGAGPHTVRIRDVNLDGRPDLLTANGAANTLSVVLASPT